MILLCRINDGAFAISSGEPLSHKVLRLSNCQGRLSVGLVGANFTIALTVGGEAQLQITIVNLGNLCLDSHLTTFFGINILDEEVSRKVDASKTVVFDICTVNHGAVFKYITFFVCKDIFLC